MNPIVEYYNKIESGDIVACKKIWTVYKVLADRVIHGYKDWHYDEMRAEHIIWFFEKYLRHSKGPLALS